MIPTAFGIIIFVVGLVLLFSASVLPMFSFMMLCSLMGGAAAISMPALGGSSIPPVHFALGFVLLRILLPGSRQSAIFRESLRANIFLLMFVFYGVALSFAGPRIFAEQISVVPMRYLGRSLYASFPLVPSSQNITAAVYLVGTGLCAVCAYVACSAENGARVLVKTGIAIAIIHMFFGITSVLFAGTGYADFLQLFRNGNYAQLDQKIGSVVRMAGIMPEPSSFASFGFCWFVFLFECWYRDAMAKWTGPLATAMAITLLFSTSSTAYVGLGLYFAVFFLRCLVDPGKLPSGKLVRIMLGIMIGFVGLSAVLMVEPELLDRGLAIVRMMTVDKQASSSAIQRGIWARQGLTAFSVSWGLGIGPGSFRSSSQFTAVIGAMGFVGVVTFVAYLLNVVKLNRASTFNARVGFQQSVGVAAAWAALWVVANAGIISPTPDPGTDFATLAGASLALRRWRSLSSTMRDIATLGNDPKERLTPPQNLPILEAVS
jgi:hypothetical protein